MRVCCVCVLGVGACVFVCVCMCVCVCACVRVWDGWENYSLTGCKNVTWMGGGGHWGGGGEGCTCMWCVCS